MQRWAKRFSVNVQMFTAANHCRFLTARGHFITPYEKHLSPQRKSLGLESSTWWLYKRVSVKGDKSVKLPGVLHSLSNLNAPLSGTITIPSVFSDTYLETWGFNPSQPYPSLPSPFHPHVCSSFPGSKKIHIVTELPLSLGVVSGFKRKKAEKKSHLA